MNATAYVWSTTVMIFKMYFYLYFEVLIITIFHEYLSMKLILIQNYTQVDKLGALADKPHQEFIGGETYM